MTPSTNLCVETEKLSCFWVYVEQGEQKYYLEIFHNI